MRKTSYRTGKVLIAIQSEEPLEDVLKAMNTSLIKLSETIKKHADDDDIVLLDAASIIAGIKLD